MEGKERKRRQIQGQQFIVEGCKDCKIYLRDFTACVNVNQCSHCELFIGPCSGSTSIRKCSNCKVIVAAAQLRLFECTDCEMLVYAQTDPSIEYCMNLVLGCFSFSYFELRRNFSLTL